MQTHDADLGPSAKRPVSARGSEAKGAIPHSFMEPGGGFLTPAAVLHLQRTVGNAAVASLLSPQSRRPLALQRYEIEGPFDINDPVHETITQEALKQAGMIGPKAKYSDKETWEYIRGAMWNDDPQGELFDKNKKRTDDYSSGLMWYRHFSGFEKRAVKGEQFGPDAELLARSHFGDLQFLHGMAADMQKASVTRAQMMMWAEFTYKVAIGEIPVTTRLGAVTVPGFVELFANQKQFTVNDLFQVAEVGDATKRAAGSLMHMIQDSYASGHTERAEAGGHKAGVVSFHSYVHQSHKKHGASDKLPSGQGPDVEKLSRLPGATDAVAKSAQILKLIKDKKPWEDAELYLKLEVFNLEPMTRPASAGNDFKEDGDKTPEPALELTEPLPPVNDAIVRKTGVRVG
jgi:hypothetical protein